MATYHKVQYYETDQMKIVHHSNYIRWFEEARLELMAELGYGYDVMEREGIISPVISVKCNYKSMTRFGETVRIETKVLQCSGVKLKLGYTVFDNATNEIRSTGESEHCFLNEQGGLVSIKKANPVFFQKLEGEKVSD